ncbi:MAG: ABC transporter ATP-binding protein [Patescibacteria group bacterium]
MNYSLKKNSSNSPANQSVLTSLRKLFSLMTGEKKKLILAAAAIIINSILTLSVPILLGQAVDKYIQTGQYRGVIVYSIILLVVFILAFLTSYGQTRWMGEVGQKVLFNLRNNVFNKLQELPIAFFNQNQAGDLISRLNNDTDKLNQFFSQTLMQFVGSIFIMIGSGIFIIYINPRLGIAALLPALFLLIFTRLVSPWVKNKNAVNLQTVGSLSAEVQESLDNFKVIVAFNRRDYFRDKFKIVNQNNYSSAISAGLASNIFTPVYGFSSNLGQLVVLLYGLFLVATGNFSLGLLVSFLSYINSFYNPLRQIAALWANFQVALAGWDRITEILSLQSDIKVNSKNKKLNPQVDAPIMEFKQVSFSYAGGENILENVSFSLAAGKSYAFVGPTGGGKTTTASLMARLYDPNTGQIILAGQDLRCFSPQDRVQKIGFILQEPFLFSGTVKENILYGNAKHQNCSNQQLFDALKKDGLDKLISRFPEGLDTKVSTGSETLSLGQKQLIAFIRAVLREPQLLILDEATANIDTVTEQLLEEILQKLPPTTTKVIIAHRLNTIAEADEIFFVNSGAIIKAGSMSEAVDLLMNNIRNS